MLAWRLGTSVTLAATLAACGGGGSQAPEVPQATTDPSASWAVKPLLGTWSGKVRQACTPTTPCTTVHPGAERDQTLSITSVDGVSFNVSATPGLYPNVFDTATSLDRLEWRGAPEFKLQYVLRRGDATWQFTLTEPGRAQLVYRYADTVNNEPVADSWSGTLTRGN